MKATINGIEVEGTPSELVDYMKRMDDLRREGTHINPPLGKMPEWVTTNPFLYKPLTTTGIDKGSYPTGSSRNCHASMNGGCFCTGACQT